MKLFYTTLEMLPEVLLYQDMTFPKNMPCYNGYNHKCHIYRCNPCGRPELSKRGKK